MLKNALFSTNIWPRRLPIKQVKDMRKLCLLLHVHCLFLANDQVLCVSEEVGCCKKFQLFDDFAIVCELNNFKLEEHSFKSVVSV